MQLSCQSCGKPIPAQDVNIELAIAKCGACHAVFNFSEQVGTGNLAARPAVGLPKRFTMENWGPELVITRRWFNHTVWFLFFFCLAWDGFLVFWYGMLVAAFNGGQGNAFSWFAAFFPIAHVAVGVWLTYVVACTFLNRTVIRVSAGAELSVQHGPVPWPGNCKVPTIDLKQLFCTEVSPYRVSARFSPPTEYGGSFSVLAIKGDDSRLTLVSGLAGLDEALFIEQQVEQYLKIRDHRVPGEVLC
jgi:hypothetical protein